MSKKAVGKAGRDVILTSLYKCWSWVTVEIYPYPGHKCWSKDNTAKSSANLPPTMSILQEGEWELAAS